MTARRSARGSRLAALLAALPRYRKSLAALLLAIGTWGVTAAPNGISAVECFGLLVALGTGLGVRQVANARTQEN